LPRISLAKESLPGEWMKSFQVEECEKVNGLELSVECRRTANLRTQCEVGTQKLGNRYRIGGELAQRTIVGWHRACAPPRFDKMSAAQIGIRGGANRRVLRGKGTATEKVTRPVFSRIIRDPLPQQAEDHEIAMQAVNAGPAQLDYFRTNWLENTEFKLLRAIVTQVGSSITAGLQTVSANDIPSGQMLDDEMIARGVKRIFIEAGGMGTFKSFVQFEIENLVAQRLGGSNFARILREACSVLALRSNQ
jgi:hypothetical protein